ncbi:hypothetical protein [Intestinimonas butyriciproducens]|uniref:hypothetical protein n=1 Tax=Intestinimonas butyriciproducens TaxID=1297617 RepID=UPI00195A7C7A|nr:hypothetical protein [Intestinimonas butyriciproducens]MBM6919214.1 hypothetical protein [Intestinimonas butyriciproducens]
MNQENKTKSLPQREDKAPKEAQGSMKMEQEIPQLLAELQALRQRERDWVFREDLEKLRKAFPDMALESIPQLGDDFLKLRSMGIDPIIALLAIRQAEEVMRPQTPPMMGPADGQSEGEEGFFAPEEVRRMTPEQVEQNLKKIEKSQRRW